MKISFSSLLLTAGLLSLNFAAEAQKAFEGTIVYSIDVAGEAIPTEAKQMFAGSEMTVNMKGPLTRTDMKMGPQQTTSLSDAKTKSAFTLMDMMGQKYKIVSKTDDKAKEATVKELPETKEIAGYKCKKAEVTMPGSADPVTVFYTDEIANSGFNSQIKGIKGYPLEFAMNQGGMKLSYTAKSVTKEKLDDSKFVVDSKDYKEMTKEEFLKSMGR